MASNRRNGSLWMLLALFAAGCVRGCTCSLPPIHPNWSMDYQNRYDSQQESAFFYDGKSMREPVAGTIARGQLKEDDAFFEARDTAGELVKHIPFPIDDRVLARGEDRYGIYCAPCHDTKGDGKGILFERANVPTPTFHDDRMRDASDGHFFDVITNGLGMMPAYRWPVEPKDRWAIIAWVRKLQEKRVQ